MTVPPDPPADPVADREVSAGPDPPDHPEQRSLDGIDRPEQRPPGIDLPDRPPPGTDLRGVPTPGEGRAVSLLLVGVILALLALIATVGWIVYDRL